MSKTNVYNKETNLTHRHSANAGVQDPRGRTGTHLTHKGELLSPANTVLLNLLPVERHKARMSDQHHYKSGFRSQPVSTLMRSNKQHNHQPYDD